MVLIIQILYLQTCLLSKICNHKINTYNALESFTDMPAQRGRKCDLPLTHIPTEAEQSDTFPSYFSSPTLNKCIKKDYVVVPFCIFVLFVGEFAV